LKASVMLDKAESPKKFEVLPLATIVGGEGSTEQGKSMGKRRRGNSLLVLHKVTETGSPFIVVAGYYLGEVRSYEGSVLAEIETIPETEYTKLKGLIRERLGDEGGRTPITFW
jgi:hypothetical protein